MEYCPYYCEENVWRLLGRPEYGGRPCWALFVFGRAGRAAVFRQKNGHGPWGLTLWDYHVVAVVPELGRLQGVAEPRASLSIIDFDSQLGWPVPAAEWVNASLVPPLGFPHDLGQAAPLARLVPGAEFVRRFYSDRSHMKNPDGSWQAPPPAWGPPRGCGGQGRAFSPGAADWTLAHLIDPREREPGLLTDGPGLLEILRLL